MLIPVLRNPAPILVEEVREAIRRLPCGKAAGYDDLPAELIKLDSDVIESVFCKLCNLIVDTGEWPDDWRRSVFVTIPKVKGAVRCEDHHMIALISHASKILTENIIEENEVRCRRADSRRPNGFLTRSGYNRPNFNLQIIMEKARESSVPLYMAFIDYKKAFDLVKHSRLWKILEDMGLCVTTVDTLKQL